MHYRLPDPLDRSAPELMHELEGLDLPEFAIDIIRYHMPQARDAFLARTFVHVLGPDTTAAILIDASDGLQAIWAWDMPTNSIMRMVLNGLYVDAAQHAALAGVKVAHCNAGGFSALEYAIASAAIADVPRLLRVLDAETAGLIGTRAIRIIVRRGSTFATGCCPLIEALVNRGATVHDDDVDDVVMQLHCIALFMAQQHVHICHQSAIVRVTQLVLLAVRGPFTAKLELQLATPVWFVHAIFLRFADTFGVVAFNLFRIYSRNQYRILGEALAVEYRSMWCRSDRKCRLLSTFFDYALAEFRITRQLHRQTHTGPAMMLHANQLVAMATQYCDGTGPARLIAWTPHRHNHYPANYRVMVSTLFLSAHRFGHANNIDGGIPTDVLGIILMFCYRYDYRFGCYTRQPV